MKIGVVTSLNRQNMTECLELWALQKTLQKRGCYVKILDVQDKMMNVPAQTEQQKKEFHHMFPDYIQITKKQELKAEEENTHSFLLTGDCIWNAGKTGLAGKALLLHGVEKKHAFGIGVQDTNHTFFEKLSLKKALQEFTDITVHTESTQKFLKSTYDVDSEIICSSALLLRRKEYNEIKIPCEFGENFIIVDQKNDKNRLLVDIANKASEETGYAFYRIRGGQELSATIFQNWAQKPGELLGLFEKAKYVITDNHETLLWALIYQRPFLFIDSKNENKQEKEMLKRLKLSANYITSMDSYKGIDSFKLFNAHNVHKRLEREKVYAYQVLNQITGVKEPEEEYVDAPTGILKKDCCGCYSCQEVCPVDAITMKPDKDGYYYPVVNRDKCIDCSLCKKSCIIQEPKRVEYKENYPKVVAAYNKDLDTRLGSSSGAIFPALAKYIIEKKHGYVAGVCYDEDMNVVSRIADNMEDVKKFYGSKYAKSQLDGSYRKIKELLKDGNYVLFSGLPCECSGLRSFLKKDYENLYICEIMCHAAPSTKVFKKYVSYLEKRFKSKVTNVTFRQKKKGWLPHQTSLVVEFADREPLRVVNRTNNYYRVFANDLIARESCTSCRFTYLNRAGDLTIGDFWGVQDIHPEIYDNKGTSFVLINNRQGMDIWNQVEDNFECIDSTLEKAFKKNHSEPIHYRIDRDELLKRMETEPINKLLEEFNDLKN